MTKVALEHANTRDTYHSNMGTRALWALGSCKHQCGMVPRVTHRQWEHRSYVSIEVAQPSGPPGQCGGWNASFTPTLIPALLRLFPIPVSSSLSPWWVQGGRQQPSAWIPAGQQAARGERARVQGHVCRQQGHVRGRGGWGKPAGRWSLTDEEVALALPAVPQPVNKRVPDLSLGTQSREGEWPPGRGARGGLGTLLLPPFLCSLSGLLPSPWPPQTPPWAGPPPNLDADFFLALFEGITAQHLHFRHDLGEQGDVRGGPRAGRGTHGPWGQHPPSQRRPSPARSPAL